EVCSAKRFEARLVAIVTLKLMKRLMIWVAPTVPDGYGSMERRVPGTAIDDHSGKGTPAVKSPSIRYASEALGALLTAGANVSAVAVLLSIWRTSPVPVPKS